MLIVKLNLIEFSFIINIFVLIIIILVSILFTMNQNSDEFCISQSYNFKIRRFSVITYPKTLIIVILDESGSMNEKKDDVIGGFNGFVDEQKTIKDDDANFYLLTFNSLISIVYNGIPIRDVPHLTPNSYRPNGSTALNDAIAEGVRIGNDGMTYIQNGHPKGYI